MHTMKTYAQINIIVILMRHFENLNSLFLFGTTDKTPVPSL